jgi:1,4-dihydroxy-2-naphthoate octaprenyltransferase
VCISLPWAVKLFLSVREFKSDPQSKVAFQGWYGPMGNWDAICQANLDWFMFRWYLARNIMTAFALLYVIVSIVIRIRGSL